MSSLNEAHPNHLRIRSTLLLLVLGLGACAQSRPFRDVRRAKNQREAGSVHLAVLAVAPWSHYAGVLQPDFRLDAQRALQEVVRDTSESVESSTRAVGIAAGATQSPDENDRVNARPASVSTGSFVSQTGARGNDAMLQYWTATALFQEVQLLNRSLRDAAIPSGFRPYLVRMQLTLLPSRRNAPYDAYTTLSFFSSRAVAEHGADEGESAPLVVTLRSGADGDRPIEGQGPRVLPLVVTDNLEGAVVSRSEQDLRNLSLAMLGFPGDFAAELSAQLFQQGMVAQVAGRDLNSLLTLGRVSDNTLRVRIGAMSQPSAGHAMVPRNHYLTVLLMVPDEAPPAIDLVAQTVLVDTETGEELAATSFDRADELLARVSRRHAWLGLRGEELLPLLERVQANDQDGYRAALSAALDEEPSTAEAHELWIDLVSLMIGSQFSSSRFELPGHGQVSIPSDDFFSQTVLLVDDLERSTLSIHGGTFGEKAEVSAQLQLEIDGHMVTLVPDGLERRERELRLTFPSLASLGLDGRAGEGLSLIVRWAGDEAAFDALYVQRRPAAAGASGG